jgi:hypothetical protein
MVGLTRSPLARHRPSARPAETEPEPRKAALRAKSPQERPSSVRTAPNADSRHPTRGQTED